MKIVLEELSHSRSQSSEKHAESSVQGRTPPAPLVAASFKEQIEEKTPLLIEDCLSQSIQSFDEIQRAESVLSLDFGEETKVFKNLISIKTSATLGAIPDLVNLKNSCDSRSTGTLSPQSSKASTRKEFGSFELNQSCNDEIAAVQELVEHKFSYNSTGNFFDKFQLPVLTLVDKSLDVENYIETNNLITSMFFCFFSKSIIFCCWIR